MAFSDIKKSISSVFEERVSSPFYGSFLFSWAVWNWKIIYLTVFVSSDLIEPHNKVDYIVNNYFNWYRLLLFPFFSSVFLVTAVPWFSNLLFKVSLYYEEKRRIEKEKRDSKKRLSIEESVVVKNELFEQVEKHQKQTSSKDKEIDNLKTQMEDLIGQRALLNSQITILNDDRKKFKILYAVYGKDDQIGDVTSQTSLLLEQSKKFQVTNTDLNGDPASGIYKDFLVLYQTGGKIIPLRAKEHDFIELKDDILMVKQSEISRSIQNSANYNRLVGIFPGFWKLSYSGDISDQEEIEINSNGQYWARMSTNQPFVHLFNIEDIFIDESSGLLEFTKVAIQPHDTRRLKNHLRIMEKLTRYEGTEDGNQRQVVYQAIA
ncbi:MAG: hypothetical protein ABI675_07370 [Chitinophagaceae bacterium]